MMKSTVSPAVLLLASLANTSAQQPSAAPLPLVSPIFGDGMVLQRGKPNTIWGWAEPGETVRVELAGKSVTGVAAPDHRWQVSIDPPPAGGPYVVHIAGRTVLDLKDVLVGDVWLCGGQSNMQLPLKFAKTGDEDAKSASFPQIRFFSVAAHPAYSTARTVEGSWKTVTPETAPWMSAVGFYFARKVQAQEHVPIGLVIDALGGTPAEAWTSATALEPLKDFAIPLAELARLKAERAPEYGNYVMHWYDRYDVGVKEHWESAALDDSAWKSVPVPGGFAELGVPETPAVIWFRREITLPDPLPDAKAMLFLGMVERMDTAYINGREVGASSWVENPRVYFIPEGVLKPGKNLLAIRVLKTKPDGGFMARPDALKIAFGDKLTVPLAGEWRARLSVDARPPHPLPIGYENWPVMPTVLNEGMLRPIAPLAITGALWYQGEQNSDRGYQYRKILPAMIADWRALFAQGDFPFYIVSLPAFKPRSATPGSDAWAETRESQAIVAASVPNSCLAATIDTGDADNIHPKDKRPVGERLAFCALAKQYGEPVLYQGPALASVERLPGSIRLHFTHADGGLVVHGAKLAEFSIAGDDRAWHWAEARIEGETIVVSSPDVPNPKEVRYAWQSNPVATLFNGAGLPAAPFRTDTWPGVTESARPY